MEETTVETTEQVREPVTEPVTEQPAAQQEEKSAEQAEEKPKEQEEAAPVIDEKFVKDKLDELLGDVNNEALTKEFGDQLKEIGITDPDMAEKALNYVCSARANKIISDCTETMQHFGATEDNLTPEYIKAMDEARTAITAVDAKVPGIKELFDQVGIQSNLKVVLMLQKLLPFVGEETGGINSGTGIGATEAVKGYAEMVFGDYPSEADLK